LVKPINAYLAVDRYHRRDLAARWQLTSDLLDPA
jgi:hypothetical protein